MRHCASEVPELKALQNCRTALNQTNALQPVAPQRIKPEACSVDMLRAHMKRS